MKVNVISSTVCKSKAKASPPIIKQPSVKISKPVPNVNKSVVKKGENKLE